MPIQDQMPRGEDDLLRRVHALEQEMDIITALAGNAAALAAAIQTGLGALATSGTTWAGPVASPSTISAVTNISAANVTASGQVTATSALSSVGAYNTDVSLLAGARQTVWQHNSGIYGFAPSSEVLKTSIGEPPFTAQDVLACTPVVFEYKAQIAIRDDPENPQYDPTYVVPTEIGLIAETLVEHGLELFVFWNEDGSPRGINYDLFGAVALLVVAQDHEARLAALEAR